ncbi:MAG: hypothetical protein ABIM60_06320, partial [candidate division WOR-3 bacterium]
MILNLILLFIFPLVILFGIIAEKLGIQRFVFHKYFAYLFLFLITWHILKKFKVMKNYFKRKKYLLIIFYFFF